MSEIKNIKAAIFDMDGTLLDSMGAWYTAGSRYMRSLGMTPPPTLDEDILRLSRAEAAAHMQALGVDKSIEEIREGFNATMDDYYNNHAMPRPGAVVFVQRLHNAGTRICVASATDRRQVEAGLRHAGLYDMVERIFTCSELDTSKSDPKIFLAACDFMGATPEDTWVFEDARHAAETAKNAGFKVCGINDASEPDQKELEALADVYVLSMEELNI